MGLPQKHTLNVAFSFRPHNYQAQSVLPESQGAITSNSLSQGQSGLLGRVKGRSQTGRLAA